MKNRNAVSVPWQMLVTILLLFTFPAPSYAQLPVPHLTLKRTVVKWPTVEVFFTSGCGGDTTTKVTAPGDFRVFDNGKEIQNVSIQCIRDRQPVSVVLVLDGSWATNGFAGYYVRIAGDRFLSVLDSLVDEVAVIAYRDTVELLQAFTGEFPDVRIAMDSVLVRTAPELWWKDGGIWDAVNMGMNELVTNARNQTKVVVVLSVEDKVSCFGGKQGCLTYAMQVIPFAQRNDIHCMVLPYNVYAKPIEQFDSLATLTGGKMYVGGSYSGYYAGDEIQPVFEQIAKDIIGGFEECSLEFEAECSDGSERELEIQYTTYCDRKLQTVTEKITYRAPLDSTVFEPMEYTLHKLTVEAGDTTLLPLELISPLTKEERFYPTKFRIIYNPDCITFNGFVDNGLLSGIPVSVVNLPHGVEISIADRYTLDAPGILGSLSFIASNPYDTTDCVVQLESWVAEAGCYIPILHDGQVTILPDLPEITARVTLPEKLVCTGDSNVYNPNPFAVLFSIYNSGEIEAINTEVELITDMSAFELVAPATGIQDAYPPAVLVGDSAYAKWTLRALPRITGDSIEVSAIITSGNHPPVVVTKKIWIPPTCPELTCALDASQRTGSAVIDALVSIANLGGETTDSTFATVILPAPLKLFGPDAPDRFTKALIPEMVAYNTTSTAGWQIDCSKAENKAYTIGVWTWSANADSVYCETTVTVELPVAACTISAPDELTHDNVSYDPNPFDLDYTLLNTGNAQLDVTEITIQLPGYITTSDPLTQSVSPLAPSAQQDLSWSLTALTSAYDREAVITVIAKDGNGGILSACEHRIFIPGVDALSCEVDAEGPLVFDTGLNDYTPNPFECMFTVFNYLDSAQTNVEVEVLISSPEITLVSPSSPVMISKIDANLSLTNYWEFEVNQLVDDETTVTITYRTRSDQYPDWSASGGCSVEVIIPPREYTYCATCTADGIDTVWSNSTNEIMLPVPFQVYTAVANNCTGDLTNVQCTITLPDELALAPGVTQTQTIKHIYPGDTLYAFWDLLATPSASDYTSQVQVEVTSSQLSAPSICVHDIHIIHRDDIGLAPSKKLVYFMALRDGSIPAQQDVMVYAGFPTEMPWTASYIAWLDVSPSSNATSESVGIRPNTTSLPYGRYWGAVDFASTHPNAPKHVSVVYDIVDVTTAAQPASAVSGLALHANYPNPFTTSTTITYTTQSAQPITLTVYNTLGVPVRTIQHNAQPGENTVQLDGLKAGMYMLVLQGKRGIATRTMVAK